MSQISAGPEIKPEDRIARRQERQKHGLIGLTARMRLDIGIGAAEELVHTFDRQAFDHINVRAASIVAAVRITLGIFVGVHRTLCIKYGLAHEIL
ncbi:hypothetical protein M2281_004390 [Mesorhizobium soli]|nr:hypothetical protein [Mesorhizobium soli]